MVVPNTLGFTWVNTTVELVPGANTITFLHHDTSTLGTAEVDFDYFALDPAGSRRPGSMTVPGGAGIPTDTDGDGLYDDVNGNGRKDFADVVLYFNQMTWIAANEPTRGVRLQRQRPDRLRRRRLALHPPLRPLFRSSRAGRPEASSRRGGRGAERRGRGRREPLP